jgi:hypothetical protein
MLVPKPRGAWSLVFADGPLAGVKGKWHICCPRDWAHTDRATGERTQYRLKEADEAGKVATLEVHSDA